MVTPDFKPSLGQRLGVLIIYLVKYALSSLLAAVFDYASYAALVYWRLLAPQYANIPATIAGFIIGWLISGATIFKRYDLSPPKYAIWFTWLSALLLVFTYLLARLIETGLDPYTAKALLILASFCINSLFFRLVVLSGGRSR